MGAALFFHVDLDAFFASVEQLDNPSYRGQPVIVGGLGKRGVVSTASYEARKFGVHSAMPMMRAHALCPHGIFLQTRMQRYYEKSKEIMAIFHTFSPVIQQLSIDEAFLDMSGMEKIFGNAEAAARLLKNTVFEKTGLHVSVGAASNKYIAKIASGKSKPNGLLVVPHGEEALFMRSLPLNDVWGIGGKTRNRLAEAGLTTIAEVLNQQEAVLQLIIGNAAGSFLYKAVRGDMAHVFNEERKSHSISTERTFETDLHEKNEISDIIFQLSAELMCRILDEQIKSRTVHIKIRYADFSTISAQQTGALINDSTDLYERAQRLFFARFDTVLPVRLIGVGVDTEAADSQLELFTSEKSAKKRKLEEAVLDMAKKDASIKIVQARLLT
ncbi:MAG: DNA polymerase IV [Treponema sp.]|uniref:DNA polymerase IV n=1 Tax=Treponema sp. TaxID=166 RepID=UPI003FA2AAB4